MFSDPQATQVNLLRHQRTEIPPNKAKENSSRKTNLDPKTWGTQMKITIKCITKKLI